MESQKALKLNLLLQGRTLSETDGFGTIISIRITGLSFQTSYLAQLKSSPSEWGHPAAVSHLRRRRC